MRPLAGKQIAGGAASCATTAAGGDFVAIGGLELQLDRSLHFVDQNGHRAVPRRRRPAGDDGCPALRFRADQGDGRPIVLTGEVFAHGEPDELAEVVNERVVPVLLRSRGARC